MKTSYLLLISFAIFCCSCKKEKTPKNSLKEYMVGSWETTLIKISYETYQKSDSVYVFIDDFSIPNTAKAQSTYKKDGTFIAWFQQADGTKANESNGTWSTKNDSLFIHYFYNNKKVDAAYKINQTKQGFDGTVLNDWDNDGKKDDTLFMKTKKINL